MLSPSDIVVRAPSLTERLATEASAEPPLHPEPTPTSMAERFAPGGQKIVAEAPGRPVVEPAVMPGLMPERGRAPANRGLLVASMLISLVPTAVILALLWQGAIRLPGSRGTPIAYDQSQFSESQHASAVAGPPVQIASRPEIALTAPGRIEATTGQQLDFAIAIDSAEALPARSVIAVRAMPEGATFSQGRPYGATEWNLTPDEIGDLRLRLPKTTSGSSDMRVELMAADGTVLASASTRLDIAPDPRAELILRSDESNRIAGLIAHGQKMVDVGYLAGARAYFRRAAEAGSGDAALLLGATFDPEFIDKIGAHGIKADPKEARSWYERAKQLGVDGAESKLKALKEDWTNSPEHAQATEADTVPATVAEAEPTATASAPADASGTADVLPSIVSAVPSSGTADAGALPADTNEWVAFLSAANVRAAPSSTADTIRVAEKGTKFRATGRKGNWVQITDPATSEVGWVYSRFIETEQAPVR